MAKSEIQRLLDGCWKNPASGCWEWQRYIDKDGYGRIRCGGTMDRAHRRAYALFVGLIPDRYEIDHLCRNRACINPAHLEAVTKRVNTLRGDGLAAQNARKTECLRGHPLSDAYLYRGARLCRTCNRLAAAAYRRRLAEVAS